MGKWFLEINLRRNHCHFLWIKAMKSCRPCQVKHDIWDDGARHCTRKQFASIFPMSSIKNHARSFRSRRHENSTEESALINTSRGRIDANSTEVITLQLYNSRERKALDCGIAFPSLINIFTTINCSKIWSTLSSYHVSKEDHLGMIKYWLLPKNLQWQLYHAKPMLKMVRIIL